jgi:hypothetical protein
VDLIGKSKSVGIYLQENKTKGDIREQLIQRQLGFDLQTMTYSVALLNDPWLEASGYSKKDFKGVRYNVVRRPLSGGKGTIKMLEAKGNRPAETETEYYGRLQRYFIDEPEYWFMRWRVELTPQDIQRFEREFLQPCLEQICDWWEWVAASPDGHFRPDEHGHHYRTPYGIYSSIAEGGSTDLDEYIATGSDLGLTRGNKLFSELQ